MTQDEIIRMARDAGFFEFNIEGWINEFERFTALVAAHKREKQTNQEPVAIVNEIGLCLDGRPIFNAVGKVKVGQKLYAAPVRTKDLTDDEIADIRMSIVAYEPVEWGRVFARAVIVADREKNK